MHKMFQTKLYSLGLIILAVLILSGCTFGGNEAASSPSPTLLTEETVTPVASPIPTVTPSAAPQATPTPTTSVTLRLDSPKPHQTIQSPLLIEGALPGNWFFEGQITARLETESGSVIAEMPLKAQGSWMTESQVSFSEVMKFTKPRDANTAVLIITNANPSGLPENNKELQIPLKL